MNRPQAPIQPDLAWYVAVSERKNLPARCPHATVYQCPRYFASIALLGEAGVADRIDPKLDEQLSQKWRNHELRPVTSESAASISGGEIPNAFSNFCPEVSFDIFKLFATTVIRFNDEIDSGTRHRQLAGDPSAREGDWRWNFEHVEPLHYSECPIYSKIPKERRMAQINIHGNVSGQLNIGGESVNGPVFQLSLAELVSRIDAANASPEEKAAAKSKLQELLEHPLVAAIVGGIAGRIGG